MQIRCIVHKLLHKILQCANIARENNCSAQDTDCWVIEAVLQFLSDPEREAYFVTWVVWGLYYCFGLVLVRESVDVINSRRDITVFLAQLQTVTGLVGISYLFEHFRELENKI